jgi:hypothetical protein
MPNLTPFRRQSVLHLRSFLPRRSYRGIAKRDNPAHKDHRRRPTNRLTYQVPAAWFPPIRPVWQARLGREEVLERMDDEVRSHFPGDPVEVVEEVVRARNGIWEGLRGRKRNLLCPRYVQLTC